ncbi:MAG TPA: DUF1464 family protein [Gemmatimonadaceae bacterium]
MPRVIGIDPGTVSIDLCGLDDGRLVLDRTFPTAGALADPAAFVDLLERAGPVDLIAGPSGYGLPLIAAHEVTEEMFRLAFLAARGEPGGIGGLRALARALVRSSLPVVFTPGVIHLPTVPAYRKVNRIDMGTADKVCATALAISEQAARRACAVSDVSLIHVELGGAFTAALAVDAGRIVDGVGGSSGPMGMRAPGALDGEVAFLAGAVPKAMLFSGGASTVRGDADTTPEAFAAPRTTRERIAWDAYVEGVEKAVAMLMVAVPAPYEIVLSGRMAHVDAVVREMARRLSGRAPVRVLHGFARNAKEGAQGAALIADGLMRGAHVELVQAMALADAQGTLLDHLYVISEAAARRRLGL